MWPRVGGDTGEYPGYEEVYLPFEGLYTSIFPLPPLSE